MVRRQVNNKNPIDREVAAILKVPITSVEKITSTFLDILMKKIIQDSIVNLFSFGRFKLVERKAIKPTTVVAAHHIRYGGTGKRNVNLRCRYTVCFSKSKLFDDRVRNKRGPSAKLVETSES